MAASIFLKSLPILSSLSLAIASSLTAANPQALTARVPSRIAAQLNGMKAHVHEVRLRDRKNL
jgi:hypothetical protein